ncbi:tetratricopeptide repeat protein [Mucilaginibacter sp.]|uniref:tetratricopeptide repeat protein n=1 Tax=Mucilaginibacter sp. TaxID=1882438 RepID=UPI00283F1B92|nr:tetratricopeptide repeat protein [Mucilaginibacter sp.]MDR3695985.1 tetratricopeptide repeat protein [Mucilaginibacter sp.]
MKYSMHKRLFYLLVIVFPLLSFGNDDAAVLFKKANDLYAKSQYKDALITYQQIIDDNHQSAAVFFNMGNAEYKIGDIPSALLYYEKAHKLSPGDEDINFNLKYANLKTTDKIDAAPGFFLSRWWQVFILSFSAKVLSVWSIVFVLLGSVFIILYFFAGSVGIKKGAFYGSLALIFLGVLSIFIASRQLSYFDDHKQAIVFSNFVNVKSGPIDKSGTLFVIHEGTKVNIMDTNNGWMKVGLANGSEGWIKTTDVKQI